MKIIKRITGLLIICALALCYFMPLAILKGSTIATEKMDKAVVPYFKWLD